jgi:hypothetical protein
VTTMRLWSALYATIWLVLVEFLLAMIPIFPPYLVDLHVVLGILIVAVAYRNFDALRATRVPGRIKRTAQATFYLTILMLVLGVLLFLNVGTSWMIPLIGVSIFHAILFVHIVNAFAVITQAAAVAIGHDMWEDHDFEKESAPGEVPPPPTQGLPSAIPKAPT